MLLDMRMDIAKQIDHLIYQGSISKVWQIEQHVWSSKQPVAKVPAIIHHTSLSHLYIYAQLPASYGHNQWLGNVPTGPIFDVDMEQG